ncbi:TIGR03826 family flagellar region protein [Paenibacillus sp. y28]|uniref:TIGR03826 family flagellar region protein n=1 Tax=Paenibacillus sp. y28 TaxID=3129110 RepID=UPI0030161647
MNVANCTRCGKIYIKNSYGMCPQCIKDIEVEYEKCLKYLRENRSCTLQELSAGTGVAFSQITRFIREGRISIANAPNMTYPCEMCGTQIRDGNICESCRGKLVKDVRNMHEDENRKHANEAEKHRTAFQIRDRLERDK